MLSFLKRVWRLCRALPHRLQLYMHRREVRKRLLLFGRPYRLHLACGNVRLEGWINVDSDASLTTTDIVWDLTQGIPVDDSSCDLVYCEHFLEHLTVEQAVLLLRECRRVLQPDGVLRIAMPSLDVLIEKSHRGSWRDQDWLTRLEYQSIQTRAEMLNAAFRWWGHQWLYDCEELQRRLCEAGFEDITDAEWGISSCRGLQGLETRKDSLLICEARK